MTPAQLYNRGVLDARDTYEWVVDPMLPVETNVSAMRKVPMPSDEDSPHYQGYRDAMEALVDRLQANPDGISEISLDAVLASLMQAED